MTYKARVTLNVLRILDRASDGHNMPVNVGNAASVRIFAAQCPHSAGQYVQGEQERHGFGLLPMAGRARLR